MTHERNLLVWQAVTSNSTIVRPSLADFLRSAAYPRLYLDFEAVSEPLPRFVGMRPHSPLAFQWSVHIERQPGAAPEQMGYLEEEGADPREAFARSLIEFCGDTGPVFVYSPYEQSRLKDLCEQLPALRPQLEAIMARLVDLLPHMRRGFYAPRMKGSWSIKKIMPCLPGGVDYEALGQQVANGDAAQAAYLTIANPATPDTERQRLIQELLVYCPTDTLALYQLVNTIPTMPTTAPNVTFPPKAPKSRKKALQPV